MMEEIEILTKILVIIYLLFSDFKFFIIIFVNILCLDTTKNASLTSQLNANVKRHLISLWRNKKSFALELVACTVTFFVYTLFFESLISNNNDNFRMNMLLTDSSVYYFVDPNLKEKNFDAEKYLKIKENHLWGSQFYDSSKKIDLVNGEKEVESGNNFDNISKFDEFIFNKFEYHNLKAALYFKESSDPAYKYEIYTLFNSASKDYSYVLKSWLLSSVLKNEYEINSDLIVK